jgi:uncharacterized paraquat-inducible protein A
MARLGKWRATYQGMACPRCNNALRHETLRSGEQTCPACNGLFEAIRFDPVEARVVVPDLAGTGPEGAAPCTRHARNQAEVACGRCGQFICSLCRIDADGKTYCPSCYERLSAEGSLASAVTRVKNWAGWASVCLIFSWFTGFFLSPIISPLAVFFCVKGLKEKRARDESDGVVRLYFLLVLNLFLILVGVGMWAMLFGAFTGGVVD